MSANQDRKQCNHETNGSLGAFCEGFRSVTGREPELWVDYHGCCLTLTGYKDETLTEEQLAQCRVIGEDEGRGALADGPKWKTLKLSKDEIEQVVRWLVALNVEYWQEMHMNSYGGSSMRRAMWASRRLNYFEEALGPRLDGIQREVGCELIGEWVKDCGCLQCCGVRPSLFPELEQELERQLQEPRWQVVLDEASRQFSGLTDDDLRCLTKSAIQRGASAEPAAEAARQIAEECAAKETEIEPGPAFNADPRVWDQYVNEGVAHRLEHWRGGAVTAAAAAG